MRIYLLYSGAGLPQGGLYGLYLPSQRGEVGRGITATKRRRATGRDNVDRKGHGRQEGIGATRKYNSDSMATDLVNLKS
jgi:hypothetical protein